MITRDDSLGKPKEEDEDLLVCRVSIAAARLDCCAILVVSWLLSWRFLGSQMHSQSKWDNVILRRNDLNRFLSYEREKVGSCRKSIGSDLPNSQSLADRVPFAPISQSAMQCRIEGLFIFGPRACTVPWRSSFSSPLSHLWPRAEYKSRLVFFHPTSDSSTPLV